MISMTTSTTLSLCLHRCLLTPIWSKLNLPPGKLPSYKIQEEAAKDWPKTRISNYTWGKELGNVVPPKILDELRAIQKLYHHPKLMLAMMGNVSIFTVNKAIGELDKKRKQDGFHLWLSYGIDALKYKTEIGALGQRNKDLAKMWKAYPVERPAVFDPSIFYDLSGLPRPPPKSGDQADGDEDKLSSSLTPEEREEMQSLYDEMVCVEKVASVYAKVAAGNPTGDLLPEFNRKSLKRVNQLHDQIHNESNNMQFVYYFLAAGTHAASDGKSAEPAWCREYTSHDEMADYAKDKANFPEIFATHVQGLLISEVVSRHNGKNSKAVPKTITPTDCVKGELSASLRAELKRLLNASPTKGFPRGPNPHNLLKKRYPNFRIVQHPGSKLTPGVLNLGFRGMNSKRDLWLDDMNNGKFVLQKVSDEKIEEDKDSGADSEEEWGGLGDF
ncbi:uncharacterized protein MELLADRAFT_88386 [Melampsora larici-populina 98AG31]|uniref:Uncharacterized protein n=1 Tax=Melampsora larici-populina (strain 98AG31 / pathotype 3-4-7) TaxID=747676 RepID=F4RRJ1_MELLP|nr:uncharacterized protein MELLADRAFT_88386 [Melampsora larici-populina 98AG31]EGG05018.1 hypothetical protein MELLADRAFT_88386 [Melampsora larici-populina 98AG31]